MTLTLDKLEDQWSFIQYDNMKVKCTKFKGPQSRILLAKAHSSARAPAYIEKKCAIPARSRVAEYPALFPCCNASHSISSVYRPHLVRYPAQFALLARVYIETLHEVRQSTANCAGKRTRCGNYMREIG